MPDEKHSIKLFETKKVRVQWHQEKWYFSIVDVVAVLTDSPNPHNYWKVLKFRLKKEGNTFIGEIENFRKVFKQREGITVSTIHGVKGEEYDTMIGFTLLDSYVPHFNDNNGAINSKKLLYVLSSRARKNLHLISETGRNVHAFHRPYGLTPTQHLIDYQYKYDEIE